MSVYVDDMFRKATVPNGARSVTGEWCHMQADTREELGGGRTRPTTCPAPSGTTPRFRPL